MIKKSLNPTLIYILSVVGLLCCCFGGVGILFSLPAFIIANRKEKDAIDFPDEYEGEIRAMNTAKIVALIVLVLNALMVIRVIYLISTGEFERMLELIRQGIEEGMKQQQN